MAIVPKSLGFINVTTAGTPVPLASAATPCNYITILPRKNLTTANTGAVYLMVANAVGGAVDNQGLVYAVMLTGGAPVTIEINAVGCDQHDLSKWYLDAASNGDGVLVGYF